MIEIEQKHVVPDEGTETSSNSTDPRAKEHSKEEGDDYSRENEAIVQEGAATGSEMPVGDDMAQCAKEDGSDEHCHNLRYADTPYSNFGGMDC